MKRYKFSDQSQFSHKYFDTISPNNIIFTYERLFDNILVNHKAFLRYMKDDRELHAIEFYPIQHTRRNEYRIFTNLIKDKLKVMENDPSLSFYIRELDAQTIQIIKCYDVECENGFDGDAYLFEHTFITKEYNNLYEVKV